MTSLRIVSVALACALASVGPALRAQQPVEPQISETFPPPQDLRKPDRTVTPAGGWPVSAVAYAPDGRSLAAAGVDKVVRLFESRTGEQGTGAMLRAMDGDAGRVLAIGFGADGTQLHAVSDDQSVRTWEVASGKHLQTVPLKIPVRNVVFRPGAGNDGQLAEGAGREIKLWNYQTGETLKTFTSEQPVGALGFVADGKTLVAATTRGPVVVWDVETAAVKQTIPQAAPANAVTLSPRGEQLAVAGRDNAVKVYDVATNTLLCEQRGHTGAVAAIAFNTNGQKMASAGADGTINYWTVPLPPVPPAELEKIAAAVPTKATATPKRPRRLLVFWRADAILHKVGVPAANHAIEMMGPKTGAFEVDFTRDYDALDPKVLAKYDAVVMNSTAHLQIPEPAKQAYLDYAKNGGGVVGVHAAIDTFRPWPEGAAVIGATFGGHPWPPSGTWAVKLDDPAHPLLRAFGGKDFRLRDEMYEMGEPYTRADRRVLLTLDMTDPATAGVSGLHRTDKDFAVAWVKRFGQGRVFYCCFGGHTFESLQTPAVLQFYLDGIQYALGDLDVDDKPR